MSTLTKRQKARQTVSPSLGEARPAAAMPVLVAQTVLLALTQQDDGASLDMALSRALKTAELTSAGRRQVVQALYDINRRRSRLIWHLEQEGARVAAHSIFLAWAGFGSPEARVLQFSPNNHGLMQRVARRIFDDPAMPEATRLECPPAFESYLRTALGDAFEREMQASLEPAPVDLRVNHLRGTLEEAQARLQSEGIEARAMPFSQAGLRCPNGSNVSPTSAFRDGLVEFQDEASQLAAFLCDARPGMQVMDFCAGTGGKTLALAATMKNKGHIVGCDLSAVRLQRAKQRLNRAGAENAERKQLPDQDDRWMKRHYARFDRVLVDAPCSGTGSWRRNPDVRLSPHAANIGELTALQDSVLARAARFVKPGGRLIYATCSLLPRENGERVAAFLVTHPEFKQFDARAVWQTLTEREWPCGEENVLRLSPGKHGTDGFFAAVLTRTSGT
jgi:16S rRNA (cytosine967-C5)-methyltransferase